MSNVQAYLRLDYDPNEALTQIAARVNALRSDLPENALDPVVTLSVGQQTAAMYMSFYSDVLESTKSRISLFGLLKHNLRQIPAFRQQGFRGGQTFPCTFWPIP